MNDIKKITKELSIHRPNGSDNLKHVQMLIATYMSRINLHVEFQSFKKKINSKTFFFTNLIGFNPNSKGKCILLGAHTDSVYLEGCESAIDAATSIAIILKLTEKILLKNPKANLILFFPDGEEYLGGKRTHNNTLSGSTYFVNHFNLNLISSVYIFDLIGGSFDNKITLTIDNLNKFDDFYKLYLLNQKYPKQIFTNPNIVSSIIRKTDQLPFLKKKVDSLAIIPNVLGITHHTIHDSFDNVNWEYISIFYKIMLEFLENKLKYRLK